MALESFRENPFSANHPQYDRSCLSLGVQPEYATGDVLLGSCYRALGLAARQESEVDLEQVNELAQHLDSNSAAGTWRFLLLDALRSPIRPKERLRLPQLIPLVPALGNYAGVLGKLGRSRWNPGQLVIYALASGVGPDKFHSTVKTLANALDVEDELDDQFAIFLESTLSGILGAPKIPVDENWPTPSLEWSRVPYREERLYPLSPAETFAQDLEQLLLLKGFLTRRQWCALFEGLLRLGLTSHVLWVCQLNVVAWKYALAILEGDDAPNEQQVERILWGPHLGHGSFLDSGQSADPYFRRQVEDYSKARLGLNLLLHVLDDADASWSCFSDDTPRLTAAKQLSSLFSHMSGAIKSGAIKHLEPEPINGIKFWHGQILDAAPSKVSGKSAGSAKNLYEFLAYTLRRREAKETALKEHDQGYLLAKAPGQPNSTRWEVRPGPVLLLAMCYSTYKSMQGAPVTLQHLAARFSFYGVRLSAGDLQDGVVARALESLGILVDSPDVGGGRLVLNPFEVRLKNGE